MIKVCLSILLFFLLVGCANQRNDSTIIVSLIVDGEESAFPLPVSVTVGEFLAESGVQLGQLDEVAPPTFTQLADGMRVTVVRVQQLEECSQREIAYGERRILNEGLQPGEERVAQPGQNGVEENCSRITVRDGQRMESVAIRSTVLSAAQDAVIYIGPSTQIDPVFVDGSLYYLSNNNIWLIRGNSINKQLLTTTGDVDGRVLDVNSEGASVLFTRSSPSDEAQLAFNRLWLLRDTRGAQEPVPLRPENVLYAAWVPGQENSISYSTGEITENAPGWQAYNDLWLARVDLATGELFSPREFIPRSSGWLYSWWGTGFWWAPGGGQLAWVRADSMGLVDLTTGELRPLLTYPVFSTRQPWSWRAQVSWSSDASLLLTTVHGQPIGSEPAETSPAFHVTMASSSGAFEAEMVRNAGIWSSPRFSPSRPDGSVWIAFLQARDIANSISGDAEYDLMVADRDGSNARRLYPPDAAQAGLRAAAPYFTWSPSGQQIAFIYGGNLWIVDVQTGFANQLTSDLSATFPVWSR